ncbi:MAG TPA: hypothetical protein VMF65_18530, partial [Acidimicrobiales bacterium]|nr:hypothetical protein [Acidimicrobiales bacterium]
IVRDLVLAGARSSKDFASYGQERSQRMRRLRLMADIIAAANIEDADNRAARRAYFAEVVAAPGSELHPLLRGAFAGPETVPSELVCPHFVESIRRA